MAEEREQGIDIRIRTTPRQSHEFLRRLARDDEFRARLEREPSEVLAEYGVELSVELPAGATRLPPREHVEAALAQIGEPDEYGMEAPMMLGYGYYAIILPLGFLTGEGGKQGGR